MVIYNNEIICVCVLCAIITQNKNLTVTQYIISVPKMSLQIFDILFEYAIPFNKQQAEVVIKFTIHK